jgi:uncharacterized protein YxeA
MKNTILIIIVVAIIAVGAGFMLGKTYTTTQYTGFVELHKTNSGTFVISKDRIYTVSELMGENPHR